MKLSITVKLGRKIKELRREYGYTQEEFAQLTKIDYKYLQKIEGKNPPNIKIETIEKLANAFKINPSKLLEF